MIRSLFLLALGMNYFVLVVISGVRVKGVWQTEPVVVRNEAARLADHH
jgi:hypothetical protein